MAAERLSVEDLAGEGGETAAIINQSLDGVTPSATADQNAQITQ